MKTADKAIIGLVAVCLVLCLVMTVFLCVGLLKGPAGPQGAQGETGETGAGGKSAFELYKEWHPNYRGTEEQWLESLKGTRGSLWFEGSVDPDQNEELADAREGDFYLRSYSALTGKSGFSIYRFDGEQWVDMVDMFVESTDGVHLSNKADFVEFSEAVNNGTSFADQTIYLDGPVDLEGIEWTPIGSSANIFDGTFDGNGNTISNLTIDNGGNFSGLFGVLGSNASVKNFTLENVSITSSGSAVGAVAGCGRTVWVDGKPVIPTIEQVKITGSFYIHGHNYVGGIIGYQHANISNCEIDVTAIETGNIHGSGKYVGGIMGHVENARPSVVTISDNKLTNVVIAHTDCEHGEVSDYGVGGIVGVAQGDLVISRNTLTNVKIIDDDATESNKTGAIIGECLSVMEQWSNATLTVENNKGNVTVVTGNQSLNNGVAGAVVNKYPDHPYQLTFNNGELEITWNDLVEDQTALSLGNLTVITSVNRSSELED